MIRSGVHLQPAKYFFRGLNRSFEPLITKPRANWPSNRRHERRINLISIFLHTKFFKSSNDGSNPLRYDSRVGPPSPQKLT